jgi:hypothetical protein
VTESLPTHRFTTFGSLDNMSLSGRLAATWGSCRVMGRIQRGTAEVEERRWSPAASNSFQRLTLAYFDLTRFHKLRCSAVGDSLLKILMPDDACCESRRHISLPNCVTTSYLSTPRSSHPTPRSSHLTARPFSLTNFIKGSLQHGSAPECESRRRFVS